MIPEIKVIALVEAGSCLRSAPEERMKREARRLCKWAAELAKDERYVQAEKILAAARGLLEAADALVTDTSVWLLTVQAHVQKFQGKRENARELFEKAKWLAEIVFEETSPGYAIASCNLARVYAEYGYSGRKNAKELFEIGLPILKDPPLDDAAFAADLKAALDEFTPIYESLIA